MVDDGRWGAVEEGAFSKSVAVELGVVLTDSDGRWVEGMEQQERGCYSCGSECSAAEKASEPLPTPRMRSSEGHRWGSLWPLKLAPIIHAFLP